ncbi:hypothetical protein C8R45DRAFT_920255 [Mycena sanguinolenta]|nr:hypothetical protein C8R45DRAFT_920255 [Mycena sanguinolenta]
MHGVWPRAATRRPVHVNGYGLLRVCLTPARPGPASAFWRRDEPVNPYTVGYGSPIPYPTRKVLAREALRPGPVPVRLAMNPALPVTVRSPSLAKVWHSFRLSMWPSNWLDFICGVGRGISKFEVRCTGLVWFQSTYGIGSPKDIKYNTESKILNFGVIRQSFHRVWYTQVHQVEFKDWSNDSFGEYWVVEVAPNGFMHVLKTGFELVWMSNGVDLDVWYKFGVFESREFAVLLV